jgi:hypothetical protein
LIQVHARSGGYPRAVNVLCDHCLLRGYATGAKTIDADTVVLCAKALGLQPLMSSPRSYAFPFQMRKIENEEIHHPGRRRKKLLTALVAIFLGVVGTLAGYLAFRWGVLESILELISKIK